MILKRMEEMSKAYKVGSDAAWAMRNALIDAEWEEIVAKNYERSPKLDEIQALLSEVEKAEQKVGGAYNALFKLYVESERNYRKLMGVGSEARYQWQVAKHSVMLKQTAEQLATLRQGVAIAS